MSAPRPDVTPRTWYIVGAGLIVSSITMAVLAFGQMVDTIEGMPRVVMPGRADITLPAGGSTLYAESTSLVGGKVYEVTGPFQYRCGIAEPPTSARKVQFAAATSKVQYSVGDFAGRNAWDVDVDRPGSYSLVCESEQPFVMAVGHGIGSWIVVAVVGLVPFILGLTTVIVVFLKRRKQRRSAAAA